MFRKKKIQSSKISIRKQFYHETRRRREKGIDEDADIEINRKKIEEKTLFVGKRKIKIYNRYEERGGNGDMKFG